ncbi:MAG: pentapeptide repeat-containing protein [Deltaproteobacteria bacterium]|nr:pentapeptide repeat-containing protein [Deltaproteobacteria bacterium]
MENVIESRQAFFNLSPHEQLDGWAIRNVDLTDLDFGCRQLSSTSISRAGLVRSRLGGCRIASSTFQASSMRGVSFRKAHLSEVAFVNCELIEADLSDASFTRLEIFESRMTNARFGDSSLVVSSFQSCDLYGADFSRAALMRVRFVSPKGQAAELSNVRFEGALLMDVTLRGANLFRASFRNALLLRVNLRDANLVEADFRGAVLVECDWSLADLDRVKTR